MDVRDWLQNVVDREPPERPHHLDRGSCYQPALNALSHQRDRHSGPSRKCVVTQQHHCWDSPEKRTRSHGQGYDPLHSYNGDSRAGHDGLKRRRTWDVVTKAYERRPRRKTRPDRYEVKLQAKRRGTKHGVHRSGQKKTSRRHRQDVKRDGTHPLDVVQNFHSSNGPQHGRLTLRPEGNLGIFTNGRASKPVAAHGAGLPDLVFNNVNFLRHAPDSPNDDIQHPREIAPKKKRNEDISAYFTRRLHSQHDGHASEDHAKSSGTFNLLQRPAGRNARRKSSFPSVTRPGKSTAKRRVSDETKERDTVSHSTPYTWSVSDRSHQPRLEIRAANAKRASRVVQTDKRATMDAGSRMQVASPAVVPGNSVCQLNMNSHANDETQISAHHVTAETDLATSQALPELPPKFSGKQPPDLPQQRESTKGGASYHTLDILQVRPSFLESQRPTATPSHKPLGGHMVEDVGQHAANNSSPNSKLLRHAFDAVRSAAQNVPWDDDGRDNPVARPLVERLPRRVLQPAGQFPYIPAPVVSDDEMLDVVEDGLTLPELVNEVVANARQAESLVWRLTDSTGQPSAAPLLEHHHPLDWYDHNQALSSEMADEAMWLSERLPTSVQLGDENSTIPDVHSHLTPPIHVSPQGFGKFWRPQKLY